MDVIAAAGPTLAYKVRRLGHLDIAGAGQVTVRDGYAFVGHLPNTQGLGTSIIDISDPRRPSVAATVMIGDPQSHSHKVRVANGMMVVNHERNMSRIGRRAEQLPGVRAALGEELNREPSRAEIAARLKYPKMTCAQWKSSRRSVMQMAASGSTILSTLATRG